MPARYVSARFFTAAPGPNRWVRYHSSTLTGAARMGAPLAHDFDSLDVIQNFAAHIDQFAAAGPAAVNTAMLVSDPKPTEDERRKRGEWLACGAP